jgi:hypothetical protein
MTWVTADEWTMIEDMLGCWVGPNTIHARREIGQPASVASSPMSCSDVSAIVLLEGEAFETLNYNVVLEPLLGLDK